VFVASSEFADAARAQAGALGFDPSTLPGIFVPHPIQNRTDAEMRAMADQTLDAIMAALSPQGG
jgi:hypothetical protein